MESVPERETERKEVYYLILRAATSTSQLVSMVARELPSTLAREATRQKRGKPAGEAGGGFPHFNLS